jgi:hypothetical protein
MATVNRLHSEPIELMAVRGGEQVLIVGAPGCACARACLVDIFGDNLLACSACLSAQSAELIGDADAMLDLITRGRADVQRGALHVSS